jgi:16S rRNA (uracil1498-N3)-methyltransferase
MGFDCYMSRRRFYAPRENFAHDTSVTLSADETRHLRDVLRLKVGDEIYVFDGEEREYRCEIAEIARASARATVTAQAEPARPESPLHLTLAVALLKGEKFDLVVQKATELGVATIIPIVTSRADVKLKDEGDAARKLARWQRIVLEATKQCGRARSMQIGPAISFSHLIDQTKSDDSPRLMFAERAGMTLAEVSDGQSERSSNLIALIGSEGGFSDEEIEQARGGGWKIVTLGGRIMRAETAAIAIAALLQNRFGDLR